MLSGTQEPGSLHLLTTVWPSAAGQVAAISGFLDARGCYIAEFAQFDDQLSRRFFARVLYRTDPARTPSLAKMRAAFQPTAERFGADWDMHDVAVRRRVVIMVSKFNHCLNDLLYRHRIGDLAMEITAVVSNHLDLQALVAWHGLRFVHLPITPSNKAEQEQRLLRIVEETGTELVILARYMQVLSDGTCERLRGRIINIHHSFLPSFRGAKPYHQAQLLSYAGIWVTP